MNVPALVISVLGGIAVFSFIMALLSPLCPPDGPDKETVTERFWDGYWSKRD